MAGYETIVSVKRKGVALLAPLAQVPCRISYTSDIVVAANGAKVPVYTYWFHSRVGVPDIRNGDLLTDSNNVQYRVSGNPEPTDQSFMRVLLDKNIAQTP